ncbi:hypothetical protein ACQYAD_12140 [Neobacillus sp. SM06]|uniref:hypothetical protein n=1 Tax=Neobacillus sp. SM06 TaxID=3422492 RepID=UPI003D28B983
MSIEAGSRYQISSTIKGYYNSAESLTVIRNNGITIQFTLAEGKGYGSMPIQHFQYLLKRSELTPMTNKKSLLSQEIQDEQIG